MANSVRNGFLFFGLLFMLPACNRAIRMEIVSVELKSNGCSISRFVSISRFIPVVGADSMQWLQVEYDSLYQAKLTELNQQIYRQSKNLDSAHKDYETINNLNMKKTYKPIMEGMELRLLQLKQIQETYRQHPEQTQFGVLSGRIEYYRLNQFKILGYWAQATFAGTEGFLPLKTYCHNYLFDIQKTNVVSITNKVPAGY
jgi:hypothetical protein